MLRAILWIGLVLAVIYLLLLLYVYFFQDEMYYFPSPFISRTPVDVNLDYDEVFFRTKDDLKLHGWWIPAEIETEATKTILFCHGNAGNISDRIEMVQLLHQLGLNVWIFDYRGYGKSQGQPSQKGTYKDAKAAWNYLVEIRGLNSTDIIIMGRSLGGAVAAWLANRVQPSAVILESTFTSASDLAAELYPYFPVRWMVKYRYPTLKYVKKITVPKFFAHSRDDEVIPFHHGLKLYEAAGEPKTFIELEGSHGNGFMQTGQRYKKALNSFISDLQN